MKFGVIIWVNTVTKSNWLQSDLKFDLNVLCDLKGYDLTFIIEVKIVHDNVIIGVIINTHESY